MSALTDTNTVIKTKSVMIRSKSYGVKHIWVQATTLPVIRGSLAFKLGYENAFTKVLTMIISYSEHKRWI